MFLKGLGSFDPTDPQPSLFPPMSLVCNRSEVKRMAMAFQPPARSQPRSPRRRTGLLGQSSQPSDTPRQRQKRNRPQNLNRQRQPEPPMRPPTRRALDRHANNSLIQLPNRPAARTRPSPSAPTGVRRLPANQQLPTSIRLLMQLQRGSVAVAFVLVTAALIVYGSTVYMQQLWSKDYRQLKTLERSERQMVAASDVIKEQIVQQAEQPGSGLVRRTKDMAVFLEPAPARPPQAVPTSSLPKSEPTATNSPLGY